MTHIKNLASDQWTEMVYAFRSKNSIRQIFWKILQCLGIMWIIVEPSSFFFSSLEEFYQANWLLVLILVVVAGIYSGRPKLSAISKIRGTDASIEIRVGDLFKQKGALIVAAPTSFDTSLEDGIISEKSIQGQYTKRYCDCENLNQQIEKSIKDDEFVTMDESEKPYGKSKIYPPGTVAIVSCNGKKAYFVALATLNKKKVAHLDPKRKNHKKILLDALPVMWENINEKGDKGPISVAVLGSGYSRSNEKREELVMEIVKSFVAAVKSGCFCDKLSVVISKSDYRDGMVDFDRLREFLEYVCKYGDNPGTERSGTAI